MTTILTAAQIAERDAKLAAKAAKKVAKAARTAAYNSMVETNKKNKEIVRLKNIKAHSERVSEAAIVKSGDAVAISKLIKKYKVKDTSDLDTAMVGKLVSSGGALRKAKIPTTSKGFVSDKNLILTHTDVSRPMSAAQLEQVAISQHKAKGFYKSRPYKLDDHEVAVDTAIIPTNKAAVENMKKDAVEVSKARAAAVAATNLERGEGKLDAYEVVLTAESKRIKSVLEDIRYKVIPDEVAPEFPQRGILVTLDVDGDLFQSPNRFIGNDDPANLRLDGELSKREANIKN